MPAVDEKLESLLRELPDPEGARLFHERATAGGPRAAKAFARAGGLLADALALAAWSPLLATTLEQNPDYLQWLTRERGSARVRETEELGESLARFALTHTSLGPQVVLARFRRRELLRVYLHDIRHASTLVETTEELSNLADAVLRYALGHAQQELENLYGAPQCADERGRRMTATPAIVALGKLGSRELNYSSDIDLLFLYSDDGETTGKGERGAVTNREFFCKLAERVAKIVGLPAGEGAAYRVDLRLRPHGRDGALAVSLAEALRYYRGAAHPWELQVLIRARAAAGSPRLFARFAAEVEGRVYRGDETVARALEHVRLAKQKIDRFHAEDARGFNVKLGRGGIREIEFVAQALQLAHGGRDPWLRAPHTLISLGRLCDRGHLAERERAELSDAYAFLRTLEHRLQMEHGLQTHTVPDDAPRRTTVARRMHFAGAGALDEFDRALGLHTSNVSRTYARVFGAAGEEAGDSPRGGGRAASAGRAKGEAAAEAAAPVNEDEAPPPPRTAPSGTPSASAGADRAGRPGEAAARVVSEVVSGGREDAWEEAAAGAAAAVFVRHLAGASPSDVKGEEADRIRRLLREEAARSLSARRALTLAARVAASLDKSGRSVALDEPSLRALVLLCGSSEFFGEVIAANPLLIPSTAVAAETVRGRDQHALLRAAVDAEADFGGELSALRRAWAPLVVEIGARDAAGDLTPGESNALQTSLAAASIDVALLVARRELARRFGRLAGGPHLAALGLGRLASGGIDFGSDLDLVLVYDARAPSPLEGLTREEAYARLVELTVAALSSMTRDGSLYRVDLRLRPDGRNGPPASPAHAFVNYLGARAEVWEWLAHVKLRAVAGDLELGRAVERRARAAVHEAARRADPESLRAETRRVRERLERERVRRGARQAVDVKYGPGGMLDVYFAARYLQLRDGVPDEDGERSTRATLERLREAGSLAPADFEALCEGYVLLRRLDHHLRLLAGRSTRLPAAADHPLLHDLALRAGFAAPAAFAAELRGRMNAVRAAYRRVTLGG